MQNRNPRSSLIVLAERIELIRICEIIAGDLRILKAQHNFEHTFVSTEKIDRLHRSALSRYSDAHRRLRFINAELKAAKMQEHDDVRVNALRDRSARRQKSGG